LDVLFSNPPRDLALAAATALLVLALAGLLRGFARWSAERIRRTSTEVDDFLVGLLLRTHLTLLVFPAVQIGSRILTAVPPETSRSLGLLTRLSLIAQGTVWAVAVVEFALRRYGRTRVESDPSAITTIRAFRFGAIVAMWIIGVLLALDNVGFDVTALIAGLGIGGVAVALATQNILSDLFASLSIVVDKPFVVGEVIKVGDDIGFVRRIGLKTTRVQTLSGEELVVSNGDLLQSRIRNYSRMKERRVVARVGVIYQTSRELLARIPEMIRAAVEEQTAVRFDRAHFAAFGDSAYEVEFVYFVLSPDYNQFMDIQQSVNLRILGAFAESGIEFAYPTRTVFLAGGWPEK
jgi:small-conductance mechanosensitive channel